MNNENVKSNVWKAGLAVAILLGIFLLVISIKELKSIAYVGKDIAITNSITVNGKGETVSIPDIATFSFSVTETAKTVDVAQAAATTKINAALKALKDNGIEDKDIKTTSYSINPHYESTGTSGCAYSTSGISTSGEITMMPYPISNPPCPPPTYKSTLTGYEVSQTIEVKVRDLKKAGTLFTTIGGLKVENVNGLTFSIDNIDKVKSEAQKLAITNAQEKAQTLAKQLGVTIVRVMSFYDNSEQGGYGYSDTMSAKTAVAPQAAPTPGVPAGEQKVTSNVSITYEIR